MGGSMLLSRSMRFNLTDVHWRMEQWQLTRTEEQDHWWEAKHSLSCINQDDVHLSGSKWQMVECKLWIHNEGLLVRALTQNIFCCVDCVFQPSPSFLLDTNVVPEPINSLVCSSPVKEWWALSTIVLRGTEEGLVLQLVLCIVIGMVSARHEWTFRFVVNQLFESSGSESWWLCQTWCAHALFVLLVGLHRDCNVWMLQMLHLPCFVKRRSIESLWKQWWQC